jgi:membrane protein required for beta-lactamase induction
MRSRSRSVILKSDQRTYGRSGIGGEGWQADVRKPDILTPVHRCSEGRFVDVLSIRQLVIVTLSGILREVLDELPIVALGVVEVLTLAIRMCVRRRRVFVSG